MIQPPPLTRVFTEGIGEWYDEIEATLVEAGPWWQIWRLVRIDEDGHSPLLPEDYEDGHYVIRLFERSWLFGPKRWVWVKHLVCFTPFGNEGENITHFYSVKSAKRWCRI